ncbi:uncharacterized protein LOC134314741 [Trichomycterus rosablanca]|uniref:uncharacterized protein LOC134314741 n=1 Tax=Trichomycterus rosablanca TaxID=2290929 RepID=UPI002F355B67
MYELHPDWAPTLNLGYDEMQPTDSPSVSDNKQKETAEGTASEQAKENTATDAAPVETTERLQPIESASKTDEMQKTECEACKRSHAEIKRLFEENKALRCELNKRKMSEQFFTDEEKVSYYTGLPSLAVLIALLNHIKVHLPKTSQILSPFQVLVITLIRLRLDLPVQHIAHLFDVDQQTVSRIFKDTIQVLHGCISHLVHWPERHCLFATIPHHFIQAFGHRVAIILNCFEMAIDKPSSPKAGAQTFSPHKNNHTMKFLTGITPQGAISFLSKGYEGSVSDRYITENSGLLDRLSPGDLVLSDRGFSIKDDMGVICAEVKISTFSKGSVLEDKDVEKTQDLAQLKMHLEKVVGNIHNKFTMLHNTVPINMILPCEGEEMTFLDKIVSVCCALTNLCPSVVPQTNSITVTV